jgi:hypothetical protein
MAPVVGVRAGTEPVLAVRRVLRPVRAGGVATDLAFTAVVIVALILRSIAFTRRRQRRPLPRPSWYRQPLTQAAGNGLVIRNSVMITTANTT